MKATRKMARTLTAVKGFGPPVRKTTVKTPGEFHGDELPPIATYAFAPVHKAALGVATGLTSGALVALATIAVVVLAPVDGMWMRYLSQYFYGYEVSFTGAAIGFFWAFITGFVAGWFLGFLKNLFTALWLFVIRSKAHLTQPFLDHI